MEKVLGANIGFFRVPMVDCPCYGGHDVVYLLYVSQGNRELRNVQEISKQARDICVLAWAQFDAFADCVFGRNEVLCRGKSP